VNEMNVLITYEGVESVRDTLENAAPDARFHFASPDEAADLLPAINILWGRPTEEIIRAAPNLRWVQVNSAGVNQLPLQSLVDRGILLCNARGMHGHTIADHVMCLILAHSRSLPFRLQNQRRRCWDRSGEAWELNGSTLGVVGLGGIGREVARRAGAFGMHIVGTNRSGSPVPGVDEVYPNHRLDEMLPVCDYLALCCPLTPDTENMIGERQLRLLPAGAHVVNIARGKIIVEEDLIRVLEDGHLGGAGLDVFVQEPLPEESPLWGMENVIITPHAAGRQKNYAEKAGRRFAENLRRWSEGRDLCWAVDYSQGY